MQSLGVGRDGVTGGVALRAPAFGERGTMKALVLFSGGQDSATCLAWALDRYEHVETVGFIYGQTHAVEMDLRRPMRHALRERFPAWTRRLGPDHVVPLNALPIVAESALLLGTGEPRADGLPDTFVPGRNLLFFTYAAIIAEQRGIKTLVGGMCETDYAGYPDCRDDTLKALQVTLNLGMASRLVIETPLMWIDKAATWQLAAQLGGAELVDLIVKRTHSCYRGDRKVLHPWGYGCADCEACQRRERGWNIVQDIIHTKAMMT